MPQWVCAHSQRDVAGPDIFHLKDPKGLKQNYPSETLTWKILHTMSNFHNFQQTGLNHWLFHWLCCQVARPIMLLPMHTWMSLRVWELHMDYLRCRFNGRVWQWHTSLDVTSLVDELWWLTIKRIHRVVPCLSQFINPSMNFHTWITSKCRFLWCFLSSNWTWQKGLQWLHG